MPRFYFDLSDGTHEPDDTGTELPGRAEAEGAAIRFLGEVLRHEPDRLAAGSLRVDVSDADGNRLFTVAVSSDAA